jgi:dTDP-4-amino-4,6-dideoxygalactose transaminase
MKVLDVGCGPADILDYLPDVDYWGFDISRDYISQACQRFGTRGKFHCKQLQMTDFEGMPLFDVVLAIGLLHHLDDSVAINVMQLASKALKADGSLLTIDPCLDSSQNPIARFLVRNDRGRNVRDKAGYEAIAKAVFGSPRVEVRHKAWIPYTLCFMECRKMKIPFNKPYMTGKELLNIAEAHSNQMLAGDGLFTKRCQAWLEKRMGAKKALLTHSCTAALEMAAILADIQPGDEVIMPSYTFVSTANAFALRGAVPVFVDIRPDTLNMDETLVEGAITPRTKAIVPVHYAGVACEMDVIMDIARRHKLLVIEDAAHGIMSSYKGQPLGAIGHLGAHSFHETKNIMAGEGGALLINDERFAERAEIIREKGTNRSQFFRGQVDKYTWVDIGSSYLPGEIIAAFLWAQMEEAETITNMRLNIWQHYHNTLASLEAGGMLRRPIVPKACQHDAHMYYVLLAPGIDRQMILNEFERNNIGAVFHYVPLHSSLAGQRYGRAHGDLAITNSVSERLIRLPLWVGLTATQQESVVETLARALKTKYSNK